MTRLVFSLALAAALTGCQATSGLTGTVYALVSTTARVDASCIRAYESGEYRLVENACPGADDRRITLHDRKGERRYASYDPAFTTWAWTEGCVSTTACGYQLKLRDGVIVGFTYRFSINLSDGEIEVEATDGGLSVTRKRVNDQPS